jgi:hypothetical protein
MYENNYKNPKATGSKELESFLQLLADLDTEVELFAIGGTAMVLKGIKEATKDIDFLTTSSYADIKRLFTLAGLSEESSSGVCNMWYLRDMRIDLFFGGFIMGTTLPADWKALSEHIRDIGKVKLYILDWDDIIITKIARSEERDIKDALDIIKSQRLDFKRLKEGYYSLAEVSLIADYDYKFKHLERELRAR